CGFEEGHSGHAVGDARMVEGLRGGLSATSTDGPFESAMKVGEGFVETLGMSGGEPQVALDRGRHKAVIGALAIEAHGLVHDVVRQDLESGVRPGEHARGTEDPKAVVVL